MTRPSRPAAALAAVGTAGVALLVVGLHLTGSSRAAEAPDLSAAPRSATARQVGPAGTLPPGPLPPAEDPAPGLPAQLALPRQHLRAPVVPIGTTTTRGLDLPADPGTLGWWAGGAAPGEPAGDTVLAGHVDAAGYGLGAFSALLSVEVGDPVELSDTTGQVVRYRVVARTSYRKSALPGSIFRTDGPAALTLVTCGGPFDSRTHHYRDNIVVTAIPTAP